MRISQADVFDERPITENPGGVCLLEGTGPDPCGRGEQFLGDGLCAADRLGVLRALVHANVGGRALWRHIEDSTVVNELRTTVAAIRIPPVINPILIAVALMAVVVSMTLAGLTAGSIVEPMAPMLYSSPAGAVPTTGPKRLRSTIWIRADSRSCRNPASLYIKQELEALPAIVWVIF